MLFGRQHRVNLFISTTTPLTHASQIESFKLVGAPALSSQSSRRHSHSRSRFRNISISVSPSLSFCSVVFSRRHTLVLSFVFKLSFTAGSNSKAQFPPPPSIVHVHLPRVGGGHGRCVAFSFNTQQQGQHELRQQCFRRHALWALERKPNLDGFTPVEISELSTPEIERRISALRMIIPYTSFPS